MGAINARIYLERIGREMALALASYHNDGISRLDPLLAVTAAAVRDCPDDMKIAGIHGWVLIEANRPQEAEPFLHKCHIHAPDDLHHAINYAHNLNLLGKYRAAYNLLHDTLDNSKDAGKEPRIVAAYGYAALHCGHFDVAIRAFERATQLEPSQPLHFSNLAAAITTEATNIFQCGLVVDPCRALYNFTTGYTPTWHHADAAAPYIERALRDMPANTDLMVSLGRTFNALSRPDEALVFLDYAEKVWAPAAVPDIVNAKADSLTALGRRGEAIALLAKAIKKDPREKSFQRKLHDIKR